MIIGRLKKKAIRVARHAKNMLYPEAIILMYHRVSELDSDPWSLAVTPKNFAEHLEIIKDRGNILLLEQLRERLTEKKSINRSFVITFDDGYADIFNNAKPLLEKYDARASVFITTSGINRKQEYWWDELERLFLQPGNLTNLLFIDIKGRTYQWELGDAKSYSEEEYLAFRQWRVLKEPAENPTRRHEIYRSVYELMQVLTAHERDQVLNNLKAGQMLVPKTRTTHRTLSHEEIIALDESGLIEIGAHTLTHPFLSEHSKAMQWVEIQNSKYLLENLLGHTVTSFAYPHGNYSTETISLVQDAGYKCACSCNYGRVKRNNNLFLLPRVNVENWDGENFDRWLSNIL